MHTTMTVNKKTTYLRLVMQVFALLLLTMPFIALPDVQPAYAQPAAPPAGPPAGPPSGPPASPTAPRRTTLVNPLGTSSISILVGRAINGFLALSGSFALLMFVYGSFTWVTSGGSPEKIAKGKKIFVWAVIGLVVVFGSYAFLNTFINALGG